MCRSAGRAKNLMIIDNPSALYTILALAVIVTVGLLVFNIVRVVKQFSAQNIDLSSGLGKGIVVLEALTVAGYGTFIALFICFLVPAFPKDNRTLLIMFGAFFVAGVSNACCEKLMKK